MTTSCVRCLQISPTLLTKLCGYHLQIPFWNFHIKDARSISWYGLCLSSDCFGQIHLKSHEILEDLEVSWSKLAEQGQAAPWPGLDPDCVSHVHSRLWKRCNSVPVWHRLNIVWHYNWDVTLGHHCHMLSYTVSTLGCQGLLWFCDSHPGTWVCSQKM